MEEDVETIIPPVRAGERTEELTIEYDHEQNGEGGFDAQSTHVWTYDHSSYHELTGLDEGADYPYIHQANGHDLRLVTDYQWTHSDVNGHSYTLSVEQKAVRGSTSYTYYYTRCGYYRLDQDLEVVRTGQERQPYRQRERTEKHIPHNDVWDMTGLSVESGEEFVRGLHSGRFGPSIEAQLHDVIVIDTPDDALTVDEYQNTETTAVSADD